MTYPINLTDVQRELPKHHFDPGRRRKHAKRVLAKAGLHAVKTGGQKAMELQLPQKKPWL